MKTRILDDEAAVPAVAAFLRQTEERETFSVLLEKLRVERGLSAPELYTNAWVDRFLYSKIMGDRHYHPAKSTVLMFGLSLKLSVAEMERLLERAGFCLSRSLLTDLLVRFCLENGVYSLYDVNALLDAHGQRTLGGKRSLD